jgi:hypothetical protein
MICEYCGKNQATNVWRPQPIRAYIRVRVNMEAASAASFSYCLVRLERCAGEY